MATSTVEIRSQQEITSSITRQSGSVLSSQSHTTIQEKHTTSPLEDTISRRVEETAILQTPSPSSSPANDTRASDNGSWLAKLQDMAARNQKRTTGSSRTKKRQSTLLTHITTAKRPRLVQDDEEEEEEEMDTSAPESTPKSALSERSARDDVSMETDELDEDDDDDDAETGQHEQPANGNEAEDHHHLTSNNTTTNGAWCTGDLERSITIHDEDQFLERLKRKFSDVGISTSSNGSGYDSGDSQQVFVKAANLENEDDTAAADALSRVLHKSDFARMKVLGQFNDSFILVMLDDYDLFIVDQHASDEKYNFEDLQANTRIESQRLVV